MYKIIKTKREKTKIEPHYTVYIETNEDSDEFDYYINGNVKTGLKEKEFLESAVPSIAYLKKNCMGDHEFEMHEWDTIVYPDGKEYYVTEGVWWMPHGHTLKSIYITFTDENDDIYDVKIEED